MDFISPVRAGRPWPILGTRLLFLEWLLELEGFGFRVLLIQWTRLLSLAVMGIQLWSQGQNVKLDSPRVFLRMVMKKTLDFI